MANEPIMIDIGLEEIDSRWFVAVKSLFGPPLTG
jgi:hypothetical protein